MSVRITVIFVDGTPPFTFDAQEEASHRISQKIFREGFKVGSGSDLVTYHSPHNIKKVEVRRT